MIGKNGMSDVRNLNNSNILLLDSSLPLDDLLKIIKKYPSKIIITFDYETHNFLETQKIKHNNSDEFLSENDLQNIQSQVYHFADWFNNENISSDLEYEKINIGKLMFEEILDYLVKFLKKFWEIKRICDQNYNNSFFATTSLYECGKKFSKSFNLISTDQLQLSHSTDKVRLNFKIGNKHFIHYISKSRYQKLKNYFEKITKFFLFSKYNSESTHSLLVEFDTVRYQDLILNSKSSSLQFLFYGRRRPAIWNLESYSIMKNSNCKIITNHQLENDQLFENVKNGYEKMKNQFEKLWQNNDFFSRFFTFGEIPFWDILNSTFVTLFNDRLESIIFEIELAKKLFSLTKIDNVLVLSEIGFTEQIIISIAKSHKIPVILIPVGLHYDTDEAHLMNRSQGCYPFLSDWFIPFGEKQKIDTVNNAKINKDKIKISACPRFNKIKNTTFEHENYVLLATTGPQPESIYGLTIKNIDEYKNTIREICKITSKHNLKLIIKQHPSPADLKIFDIVNEIDSNILVVSTGDISDLIKSCKIMVSIGISTVILEAQIYQKPILALSGINYEWGHHSILDSCLFSNSDDLEQDLLDLFNNESLQHNIVQKGSRYLHSYISNLGTGTKEILNFLKSTSNNN